MNSSHTPRRAPTARAGQAGSSPVDPQEIDELLAQVPEPLQPLELSALDGFLVGVLLQPQPVAASRWLPWVTDEAGRPGGQGRWAGQDRLEALVTRRHRELDELIEHRQWFDPWVTDVQAATLPSEAVRPWVLGFAAACSEFPELTEGPGSGDAELNEALAQIYQHLQAEDLEDADALLAEIDSLEPPATMDEAVESLVRGCLLLADHSRPRRRAPARRRPSRGSGA